MRKSKLAVLVVASMMFTAALGAALMPSADATGSGTHCVPAPAVAAYDETVVDSAAVDKWYSWTGGPSDTHPFPSDDWNPDNGNHNGFPQDAGLYQRDKGNSGQSDWFYHLVVAEVSHVVHHDAVPEVTCPPTPTYSPTPTYTHTPKPTHSHTPRPTHTHTPKPTPTPTQTTPPTFPAPALFNADPTPASCQAAGTFDFSTFDGDFPNVTVTLSSVEPGTFLVTVTPNPGYVITGLDLTKWDIDDEGVATRTIVVEAIRTTDPQTGLPCQLAVIPLAPPIINDVCGTQDDTVSLPSSPGLVYQFRDEVGPDVEAFPAPGNTVALPLPEGWEEVDTNFYRYVVTFTDEPCPTVTPTPTPTETTPAPTPTETTPAPTPTETTPAPTTPVDEPSDEPTDEPTTPVVPVDNPQEPTNPTPPLAHTGSDGVRQMIGLAALVTLLGMGGVAAARRRRV